MLYTFTINPKCLLPPVHPHLLVATLHFNTIDPNKLNCYGYNLCVEPLVISLVLAKGYKQSDQN